MGEKLRWKDETVRIRKNFVSKFEKIASRNVKSLILTTFNAFGDSHYEDILNINTCFGNTWKTKGPKTIWYIAYHGFGQA